MKILEKIWERRPSLKSPAVDPEKKVNKKKSEVKKSLLQTYFTSLLSLLLCVTMFFGTSYAWFTSEVTNTANEIYIGTLKVGLYKESKDAATGTVETQDLADSEKGYKLFDNSVRWEPGYTAIETIQVVNKGDLAFKYIMTFTDGTLVDNTGASLSTIADNFEVWVFDYQKNEAYAAPASYNEIAASDAWVLAGTLAEVLDGKTVLSGTMQTVRDGGQNAAAVNPGTTDGVSTTDKFTIALHMKETAGAEMMGHRIRLNVKLIAYQMKHEADAFGNAAYDENIVLTAEAKELKDALESGANVVLSDHIDLTNADAPVAMSGGILDGNGKSITYNGTTVGGNSAGVVTASGGKISNLTINGNENGCALYVTQLTSDLVMSNCVLSGASSFKIDSEVKNETAILSFNSTRFASVASYDNVAQHAYFNNCTFDNALKPGGDTTLVNCTFATDGLDVSALGADETIKLINCTYNGQPIEKAVVTANDISESTAIRLESNKVVLVGIG